MTIYYVDSAAGSNTSPYDTWAKAATTLATIAAIDAAGDTVYVASTHAESTASNVSLFWAGTAANPTLIICADKTSGAPPATLATGASVTSTGNSSLNIHSGLAGGAYFYGINFVCASGGTSTGAQFFAQNSYCEKCNFYLENSGFSTGSPTININTSSFIDCGCRFNNSGQGLSANNTQKISGMALLAGGVSPSDLFAFASGGPIAGIDLTNASASVNIFASTVATASVQNCKMPTSWSGALTASASVSQVLDLFNADYSDTNYISRRQTGYGDIYSEVSIVKSGGASNGAVPLSWRFASNSTAGVFPVAFLQSVPVVIWNDSVASARTVTIDCLRDSATNLTNKDIWLEVEYLGSSATPLSSLASGRCALLGTAADWASSSASWATGGMSNPNKQKMSVTFTPQMKGFFSITVKWCKASATVYVDPKALVT